MVLLGAVEFVLECSDLSLDDLSVQLLELLPAVLLQLAYLLPGHLLQDIPSIATNDSHKEGGGPGSSQEFF